MVLQRLVIFWMVCFSINVFAVTDVIGKVSLDQNVNLPHYIPENLKQVSEVFISRDEYVISFNPGKRLMNWAAWKLEASDIGHAGRTNNFAQDPDLQGYLSKLNQQAVTPADYKGTCFDRGHQVPSADRDTSVAVNDISFLMSNMIPQTAFLNRVAWEHLEQYARDLVNRDNKKLFIFAGPIFDENFGAIGPNKDIPVPSKDFKIIFVLDKNQTFKDINSTTKVIAVVMPNLLKNGKKPLDNTQELCAESVALNIPASASSATDWMQFQMPLSDVEKLAGFKFVPGSF